MQTMISSSGGAFLSGFVAAWLYWEKEELRLNGACSPPTTLGLPRLPPAPAPPPARKHAPARLPPACCSATGMKWVEVKMRELGVSTHPDYKLAFMLDHLAMITVQHPKYGACGEAASVAVQFEQQRNTAADGRVFAGSRDVWQVQHDCCSASSLTSATPLPMDATRVAPVCRPV